MVVATNLQPWQFGGGGGGRRVMGKSRKYGISEFWGRGGEAPTNDCSLEVGGRGKSVDVFVHRRLYIC